MSRFSPYLFRDFVHWYVNYVQIWTRAFYLFGRKVLPAKDFAIYNLVYNNHGQCMEFYVPKPAVHTGQVHPKKKGVSPKPIIAFVHGGAWTFGFGSRRDFYSHCLFLVKQGYPVATIGYRLSPKYRYPAGCHDVEDAVRFLSESAGQYLDPKVYPPGTPVILIGHSAGGHLVLLNTLKHEDLPVSATVSLAGPTDLTTTHACKICDLEKRIFLGPMAPEEASPIQYIRPDAPPIILYHGNSDSVVDVSQSQDFYDAMKEIGANITLNILEKQGHWFPFVSEKKIWLDSEMLLNIIESAIRHASQKSGLDPDPEKRTGPTALNPHQENSLRS